MVTLQDKIDQLTLQVMKEEQGISFEEARLMCMQLMDELSTSVTEFNMPNYMQYYDASED